MPAEGLKRVPLFAGLPAKKTIVLEAAAHRSVVFQEFLSSNPEQALVMLRMLSQRLRQITELYAARG